MDETYTIDNYESELEEALNPKHLPTLKNSVDTRWSSILTMIKSFAENLDVLNIILLKIKKENLLIPEMEHELIKEFGEFLEIFSVATTYLQGQEYATISTIIYFFENIHSNLVQRSNSSSFGILIHLYDFAKLNFYKRFKILKVHLVAALLDPCQKDWKILNNYLKKNPDSPITPDSFALERDVENPISKEKLILMELEKNEMVENSSCSSSDEPAKKKKELRFKIVKINNI